MSEFPKIPGYKIVKKLGEGGMADVYLADDEKLERKVAIKILHSNFAKDEKLRTRFLKEAKTAANLQHSNIVSIFDMGKTEDGEYYFAMEVLNGGSLKEKLENNEVNLKTALWITKEIAKALDYAHERGFVHRDIKPANIMFRADGVPVLADFGIAKAVESATKLTQTGASIGTPYYMSPEQIRGENLDGKSDIYSLGVALYEMLTGYVPYDADTSLALVLKHLQEPIPELPSLDEAPKGTKLHNELKKLLNNMLSKSPSARYSAKDVINHIDRIEKLIQEGKALEKEEKPEPETTLIDTSEVTKETQMIDQTLPSVSIKQEVKTEDQETKETTKKEKSNKWFILALVFFIVAIGVAVYLGISSKKAHDEIKKQNKVSEETIKQEVKKETELKEKTIPKKSEKKAVETVKNVKSSEEGAKKTLSNKLENKQEEVKSNFSGTTTQNQPEKSPPKKFSLNEVSQSPLSEAFSLLSSSDYEAGLNSLFQILEDNPELKNEALNELNKLYLKKSFRLFVLKNSDYLTKIRESFPELFYKLTGIPKLLDKPAIEKLSIPDKYDGIVSSKNSIVLFNKKNIYFLKNKKSFSFDSKLISPPTVCGTSTFFATERGKIYASNSGTPPQKIYKTRWDITKPPASKGGKVCVSSLDDHIYCFNCSGGLIFKHKSNWRLETNPAIDEDGNVYFIKKGGYLVQLTPSGKKNFELKIDVKSPDKIFFNGTLFALNKKGSLIVYNRDFAIERSYESVYKTKEEGNYFYVFRPSGISIFKKGKLIHTVKCSMCKGIVKIKRALFGVSSSKIVVVSPYSGRYYDVLKLNISLPSLEDIVIEENIIYALSANSIYKIKITEE